METLELEIERLIRQEVRALNRSALFRQPLISFSAADDPRYMELKKIIGKWHLSPKELMEDARSVISYFVPFTKEVAASPKLRQRSRRGGASHTL